MNESCPSCESVVSNVWMSCISHVNELYRTYETAMSHIWNSHVTHMSESCHTYEWVTSHIRMSHVTHMNESYHTYEWFMPHAFMSMESCHTHQHSKRALFIVYRALVSVCRALLSLYMKMHTESFRSFSDRHTFLDPWQNQKCKKQNVCMQQQSMNVTWKIKIHIERNTRSLCIVFKLKYTQILLLNQHTHRDTDT